jgi:hypothetical protein
MFNPLERQTSEALNLVIGDWERYLGRLQRGRPIFDAEMHQACESAFRAIGGALGDQLSRLLGSRNQGSRYIQALRESGSISGPDYEEIFGFSLGSAPEFSLPSNWSPTDELRLIRFQLYRPGLADPSRASMDDAAIFSAARPIPLERAHYREAFPAFDLEFRLEIVTSRSDVKDAVIQAASDALRSLREAHAAHLKASK